MKSDIVIALDVGGTYTKGCVIENGIILEDSIQQFDSHSNESAEFILQHFVNVINYLYEKYRNISEASTSDSVAIGMAFPGPFDYEKGISYIKGLNKFEALYNYNVHDALMNRLKQSKLETYIEEFNLRFENDGRLFGLGASTRFPNERIIALTIGTGLGSVFINHGKIVKDGKSIPAEGYLYNQPFKDKTIDDFFSRRGILKLAKEHGIQGENIDVKEIAELARYGDKLAQNVFNVFGKNLSDMLYEYIETFQPHRIIIGGQIGKSFDLFNTNHHFPNTKINSLDQALRHTFLGIDQLMKLG